MKFSWLKISKNNFQQMFFDGINFSLVISVLLIYLMKPNENQSLDLKFNLVIFILLFFMGIIFSYFLNKNNLITLGEILFIKDSAENTELKAQQDLEKAKYKNFWFWQMIILVFILFSVGLQKTNFSFFEILNKDGFEGAKRLFKGIFNPNWNILPKAILNIIETLFTALMATVLAVPIAFVISFLSAKNIMNSKLGFVVYLFMRLFFNVTRSIEVILWAIIFSVWVGIGPFAGMLALMVHSVASLAKQYSEMIETVTDESLQALQATGANQLQILRFGVLPQVTLPFISFTMYRWDINVRMATVIGLVGGGGIGSMLIQYQGQAMWSEVGTIIIVVAFVVWILDQTSAYVRESLK